MSDKLRDYEIYSLFEKLAEQPILERILILQTNEARYKKSDFYKVARIPLVELYKNYLELEKLSQTFSQKFDSFIKGIDEETVVSKIVNILDKLENEDKVQLFLEKLIGSFDISKLNLNQEELTKLIKSIKKI